MKRIISLVLLVAICVCGMASCAKATVTNIDAKIIGVDNEVIFEGKVIVTVENPTVMNVLEAMERYGNVDTLEVGQGNTLTINGITTSTTEDGKGFYFWSYELNGVSENDTIDVSGTESYLLVGLDVQPVKDGDKVSFVYTYTDLE